MHSTTEQPTKIHKNGGAVGNCHSLLVFLKNKRYFQFSGYLCSGDWMRGGGEGSRIVANKGHLFWEFFVEPRHRDDSRIFFSLDVTGILASKWAAPVSFSTSAFCHPRFQLDPSFRLKGPFFVHRQREELLMKWKHHFEPIRGERQPFQIPL